MEALEPSRSPLDELLAVGEIVVTRDELSDLYTQMATTAVPAIVRITRSPSIEGVRVEIEPTDPSKK